MRQAGVRGVRDDLLLVDRQLAADCLCGVEGGTQRVHGIIREITDIRAVELRLRIGNGSVESGIIGALRVRPASASLIAFVAASMVADR